MKKILSVLLALCMLLTVLPLGMVGTVAHAAGNTIEFAGGSGTAADPYLVSTKAHLNNVRKHLSSYFKMTTDIVFTDADYSAGGAFFNESDGWEPIGTSSAPFTGTFDGGYYSIYNLQINRVSNCVGMFGYMSGGTVQNLRLRNATVQGDNYVGGVVGYATPTADADAYIAQCYMDGTVDGREYVGGICGYMGYANENSWTLTQCYNKATVTATRGYCGGIVGYLLQYNTVSECVNEGNVTASTASYNNAGGIVGQMAYSSNIQNCYNKGTVTAYNVGGIVSRNGDVTHAYVKYCYDIGTQNGTNAYPISSSSYISQTACFSLSVDGADALADQRTFMDWNFNSVWTMAGDPNYPYPELRCFTLQGTTTVEGSVSPGSTLTARFVGSAQQPDAVTYAWYADGVPVGTGATYTVTAADMDARLTVWAISEDSLCAGVVVTDCAAPVSGFAGGSGTAEDPYLVSTKAHLNNVRNYRTAHFKMTADIVFTEADFGPNGAFYNDRQGWAPIGTSSAPFTGTFDGGYYSIYNLQINRVSNCVGLFGYVSGGTVKNLRLRSATVQGDNCVGGVVGYATPTADADASIAQCYVDGTVDGRQYVGGICGEMGYANENSWTLTQCYNKAAVTATTGYCGGIVGYLLQKNKVTECINEGAITASTASYNSAGGIVGQMAYSSNIQNCYNKGTVTAYNVGGIVSRNGDVTHAYVKYCYDIGTQNGTNAYPISYSSYISQTACYSLSKDGAEALSNKRTFMDWNFDSVWTMAGDPNYPYPELRCFNPAAVRIEGTVAYGETVSAYFSTGGAYPETIAYEWYVDGVLVGTGTTYTITDAAVGKYLTVRAITTDVVGTATLNSGLYLVAKTAQAATPVAPAVLHTTDKSFILSTQPGQEYSIDNENWQPTGAFSNLLPNHEYVVYVRIAETATHLAGEGVDLLHVTTALCPIAGAVAIQGEGRYGETLRANVSTVTPVSATVSYAWMCGETVLGTGATYTVKAVDVGQTIFLLVSGTGDYTGSLQSDAITCQKAVNSRVAPAPVVQSKTGGTITLVSVPGCEYSIDRVNWNIVAEITDLSPVSTYTVYQRYAATSTHEAGPISEGVRVTTDKNPVGAAPAPQVQSATGNSVTLVAVYGCQYSKDGVNWQNSPVFTGLRSCTAYTFYMRYAETDSTYAGPASASVAGSTLYTHTYDNVCDPTCNVCGAYRQTEPHVYDNNCDDECNVCGMLRGVSPHVYDNACDTTCNECGATRSVLPHVYDNACDVNCNVCGAIRSVGAHPYMSEVTIAATCGADGLRTYTCSACGISYTEAIPATGHHIYDNNCDPDCNNCADVRIPSEHVFDSVCDTTCNVCGYLREVAGHAYDDACDPTCNLCGAARVADDHVYDHGCDAVCNVCGESRSVGAHVYDHACDVTCNICGATRAVGSHTYGGEVTTAATCGVDGLRTYTCSACGDTYTEVILATGRHTYANACDATCNACGQTRVPTDHVYDSACDVACNVCGATRIVGEHVYTDACDAICNVCGGARVPAAHVYDHGCDTTCNVCGDTRVALGHMYDHACDVTCNICGATRAVGSHTYGGEVTTAATCGVDGLRTYTCSACGDTYTEVILATGRHTYANACDASCNACGQTRVPADHVYDSACDVACNVCGATRIVGEHLYDNACDATCAICNGARVPADHVYASGCDTDCDICNATREVMGHRYDNACDATCNICNIKRDVAEHIYSHACDTTCNVCNAMRTVDGHLYDNACDATCNTCGAIREPAEHKYDSIYDATCSECDAVREVETPADAPAFVVDNAKTCYGNTFTVAVRTEKNPGVVAFRLNVHYDTTLLELVAVEEGAFAGITYGPTDVAPFTFTWCDAINPDNSTNDAVVLLTFRAKEGTEPTETAIALTYDAEDVYNAEWESIYFRTVSGMIHLTDVTPGDADGNGKVNVRDLGLLQQYLNGWSVSVSLDAADVTGDGKVNVRDLGLIQQYLNGWNVELG